MVDIHRFQITLPENNYCRYNIIIYCTRRQFEFVYIELKCTRCDLILKKHSHRNVLPDVRHVDTLQPE